eukprot:123559-Chlamydomonas_euryale.AAC.2
MFGRGRGWGGGKRRGTRRQGQTGMEKAGRRDGTGRQLRPCKGVRGRQSWGRGRLKGGKRWGKGGNGESGGREGTTGAPWAVESGQGKTNGYRRREKEKCGGKLEEREEAAKKGITGSRVGAGKGK